MSIYRIEYCPTCKKTVSAKSGICKKCGNAVKLRGYGVRLRTFDENGQLKNIALTTFPSQRAAKQAEAEYKIKHSAAVKAQNFNKYNITLDDLYFHYMAYNKTRLKPSTVYDMSKLYERAIQPYFGKYLLPSITKQKLMSWQAEIDKKGLRYTTKMKLRNSLQTLFKFGVFYFDLPHNPFDSVPPFRNTDAPKKMQIWTPEEFEKFIGHVTEPRCNAFFKFLYYTGCRKGEAQALAWEDIDFKNETISINKSLSRKSENGGYYITTPKNRTSTRVIRMPKVLFDTLKELPQAGAYVFGGDSPLCDMTISRKLSEAANKAGLTPIRVHDFRHSHASYLISQGVDIVSVARRLGHANIEQTLNTYSHVLDDNESAAMEALNAINF